MRVQSRHSDDQLIEEDYDDIQDENFQKMHQKVGLELEINIGLQALFHQEIKILKQLLIIKINLELIIYPLKEFKLVQMIQLRKKFRS